MKQKILRWVFRRRQERAGLSLLRWYVQLNNRPTPLKIGEDDRCLCIAPHPDDETIGMGGTLARYASQFSVACLTGGEKGARSKKPESVASIRIHEFEQAMRHANVRDVSFLGMRDRKCIDDGALFSTLKIENFNLIFVPGLQDAHRDHKAAAILLERLISQRKCDPNLRVVCYEVWTAIGIPNRFVDISAQVDTKRRMIAQYALSCASRDYAGGALGLNAYRGLVAETAFAEAFWELPAKQFCAVCREIYGIPNPEKADRT